MKHRGKLSVKQSKRSVQQKNNKNASTYSKIDDAEVVVRSKQSEAYYKKLQAKPLRKQAQKLLQDQKYEEAIEKCRQAIELDPVNSQAYFLLGNANMDLERNDLALEAYKEALRYEPNNVQILYQLGDVLFNLKLVEKAYGAYQQAIKRDYTYEYRDENILAEKGIHLLNEGLRLSQLKCFEKAIDYFKKALLLCSENVVIYLEMGNALAHLKRYEEALEKYNRAIQIEPKNARAYIYKGDSLSHLKRYREALFAYEKAIQLDSQNAENYLKKGLVLYNLKCYKETFIYFKQSVSINSSFTYENLKKNMQVLRDLGHIFFSEEQYNIAREIYEIAIKFDPTLQKEYLCRGEELLEVAKKQYELANYLQSRLAFSRAIEFNSQYESVYRSLTEALMVLGTKYLKDGQPEKALKVFDNVVQFSPAHPDVYKGKGDALFAQSIYTKACDAYNRAAQLSSTYSTIFQEKSNALVERGNASYRKGEFQDALVLYNYALQFNKNNPVAYDAKIQTCHILGAKEEEERTIRLKYAIMPEFVDLSTKPFIYNE